MTTDDQNDDTSNDDAAKPKEGRRVSWGLVGKLSIAAPLLFALGGLGSLGLSVSRCTNPGGANWGSLYTVGAMIWTVLLLACSGAVWLVVRIVRRKREAVPALLTSLVSIEVVLAAFWAIGWCLLGIGNLVSAPTHCGGF